MYHIGVKSSKLPRIVVTEQLEFHAGQDDDEE
jgi:hypothetical protein